MTSLYIDRRGVEVRLDGEALAFYENGERSGTVPIAPLSRVFIRGDVTLKASLLAKLGEANVGVVVLSGRKSTPTMLMARPHNDASRRIAQYKASLSPEFVQLFSSCVVERKIQSQREFLLSLYDSETMHRSELSLRIRHLEENLMRVSSAQDRAALRGVEGQAALEYFAALEAVLPESLKFSGRNRRPPRDPFNVVLSLGYTLLQAEAVIALYGAGLDPFIGFFHALDFGRESLACDVIEEYRAIVDRFAFRCFREKTLRPEDFSIKDDGCFLGKAGRQKFYPAWEREAVEEIRKKLTDNISALSDAILESAALSASGDAL